ncbi:MAG: hypothetical protein JXA78_12715 [Anaerolineales bacterium]|nr:hypothetical protein [Anaerolineales bacterium]
MHTLRLITKILLVLSLAGCATLPQSPSAPMLTEPVSMTGPTIKTNPQTLSQPAAMMEPASMGKEPPDYTNIAAGAGHTCMVTSAGGVQCWGGNQYGQLGGGSSLYIPLEYSPDPNSMVKTTVRGLAGRATAISTGWYHTCALIEDGEVQCWGWNAQGQLGDGTTMDSNTPVGVQGLDGRAVLLAAGAEHTCALLESGVVRCWGENKFGQLGNASNRNSRAVVGVQGLPEGIVQVAAGTVFTCALTGESQVFCWGDGQMGRFGDDSTEYYTSPVLLEGLDHDIKAIVAGDYHLCALSRSGQVNCWGALSSEEEFTSRKPFAVNGLSDEVVQISAGSGYTCVLTTSDGVKCWGDNYFGQLGNGSDLASWEPVDAMRLTSGVMKIASGPVHVCAILMEGSVQCWGDCSSGQCGDSTITWTWNDYTNREHYFSVSYPAGYNFLEVPNSGYPSEIDQVWFASSSFPPAQTGARADIVLMITEDDPTPNWAPQFFDNYKSETIQLDNVQAVRISGKNKESLSEELVVIAKIGGYYLQALPNHSTESLKYFDQMIASLHVTWELIDPMLRGAPTQPAKVASEGKTSTIELVLDAWLAETVTVATITEYVDPSGFGFNDIPEHIRVDFANPYTLRQPFASLQWAPPWRQHQTLEVDQFPPQIFVFPVAAYKAISQQAGERIESLENLLGSEIPSSDSELPVLPLFNSAQDLRAQAQMLEFQNGRGIRFIARYSQEAASVVNPTVFYTFQGLTEDGKYYVAAFFPLYTKLLPDQALAEDWGSSSQPYPAYLGVVTARLEELRPEDFSPWLDLLDQVIQSITIHLYAP